MTTPAPAPGLPIPGVVEYAVDDRTVVQLEIAPAPGMLASTRVWIRDAAAPAFASAAVLLEEARGTSADKVEIRFGLKATGDASWMISRAPEDANFEIRLTWAPASATNPPP